MYVMCLTKFVRVSVEHVQRSEKGDFKSGQVLMALLVVFQIVVMLSSCFEAF